MFLCQKILPIYLFLNSLGWPYCGHKCRTEDLEHYIIQPFFCMVIVILLGNRFPVLSNHCSFASVVDKDQMIKIEFLIFQDHNVSHLISI